MSEEAFGYLAGYTILSLPVLVLVAGFCLSKFYRVTRTG